MPDLARDGLVNRNPGVNVRGAFFHPHAGQKGSVGAGVIAATIHAGRGIQMIQPADHLDLVLVRRQRLQRAAQLKIRSFRGRPPRGGNRAVRKIDKGGPQRRARGRCRQIAGRRNGGGQKLRREQRFKGRQREAHAEAAQKMPPAETGVALRRKIPGLMSVHNFSFAGSPVAPAILSGFKLISAVAGEPARVF